MALGAPATVDLGLAAAAEAGAGARVVLAATRPVAAEGLHATLLGVPAPDPAPAPRHT